MKKPPPPKGDPFDGDALWLSIRLGVVVSLVVWCFHPALVEARYEAMMVAALVSLYGIRALLDYVTILRLRAARRRDRDYWSMD